MNIEGLSASLYKLPFILVKDGVVNDVNHQFTNMMEFTCDDLLNKSIEDLFNILRVGPNANPYNICGEKDYFIFTKSLDVRMVNIEIVEERNEKLFFFKLQPKSNIHDKYPFISKFCSDNYDGVAIFSLPDITLLKANETFVSFFDEPFNKLENCIGKRVSEFVTGFEGSTSEKVWEDIVETGQSFYTDEYRFDRFERGITYWKSTITPIHEEGKLKYCVEVTKDITEQVMQRRKIEEQAEIIRLQNEKLRWQADLLNLSSEVIFTWKLDGEITSWNKGAEQLYGYNSEEAVGSICHELLQTKYPLDINELQFILKDNEIWRGIIKHTCKEGKKRSISTSHQIVTNDNGEKIVLEINHDITQIIRTEEQVKQQKNELEEIIQGIDDAIFIYDSNKKFYLVNKAGKELYKDHEFSNFENLRNKDQFRYYDENGNEISTDNLIVSRVSRGEIVTNYKMTFKTDLETKHMSVNGRPIYDKESKLKFIVLSCRNITKDIETQRSMEQQKKLLETIIDTMQESLYVVDRVGNYITSNKLSKERLLTAFETIEQSFNSSEIYDSNGKRLTIEELPAYSVFRGETIKNQVYHYIFNEREIDIVTSGTPIFDEKGNIRYAVISTRDISNIIQSEKALKQTQEKLLAAELEKNRVLEETLEIKDEFLSLISHEFRTPLNVINTAIQAINYFCINDLPEKAKKYLDMIKLNAFRQLRLVNNLLDITRADAGRIKINKKNLDIVFISKAITESVETYAYQKGIAVDFTSSFAERTIGIDDEKYERILLNLLSNAIKFTPKGKSIVVRLTLRKKNICIQVQDEGIGIPKDKKNIIFERFGQVDSSLSRQAEGTGIGLSLVKRFVEALGGSVSVKSTVGKGSTFTILLPDEVVIEEDNDEMANLMDNRLVQVTNVEFSDIYL